MSKYLSIDSGPPTQVASNLGWSELCAYAATLDGADALRCLCEYGWCEPASALLAELTAALADAPPDDAPTAGIVQAMIDAVPDDDSPVTVTEGFAPQPDTPAGPEPAV